MTEREMAIIGYDPDYVIDYIPAYGGNRKSDNPIVVKLRFVPYKKILQYTRMMSRESGGLEGVANAQQAITRRQFCESVEAIENCEVMGPSGIRKISTPEEFFDVADNALIKELIGAMENASRLSEGQRKN